MTEISVELAAGSEAARWDAFVEAHPDSSYGHRWAWREILEGAYGRSCYYLSARRGAEVVGALPLVHMPGRLGGNRLVSMPYLDRGGLLAAPGPIRDGLREASFGLLDRLRASRLELRGVPFAARDAPETTRRYRFVLPLPETEEELWDAIGPKVRNQIRKSQREGLETQRVAPRDLSRFYDLFARNMRDLGSPVHSSALFRQVLSRFGDDAGLYLTLDAEGRAVGGGIALRHRNAVVVPWASSLLSARSSCPNHSLYWRVLRDAAGGGATEFDFGRSSEGTGTYQFKKQWGALAEPLHWTSYDRERRPRSEGAYLSAGRNERLARAWSRLPLVVSRRLGPVLRKRLPN